MIADQHSITQHSTAHGERWNSMAWRANGLAGKAWHSMTEDTAYLLDTENAN